MTDLLQKAMEEAAKLPGEEQDRLARWILAELAAEHRWDEALAASADKLERLAADAVAEDEAGFTTDLDPDKM